MYGNWRFNLITGLVGSIFVFIIAITKNPLLSSLLRTFYSFVAFFLIAYLMRYLLGTFIFPKEEVAQNIEVNSEGTEISGQNIDYSTEQEDVDLNDLLKEQLNKTVNASKTSTNEVNSESKVETESFKPLKPTQLFSNKSVEPEEMSKAIRHLTGE